MLLILCQANEATRALWTSVRSSSIRDFSQIDFSSLETLFIHSIKVIVSIEFIIIIAKPEENENSSNVVSSSWFFSPSSSPSKLSQCQNTN